MAAKGAAIELRPPLVLLRPTWRLLILVGWCFWEASQRVFAAKVFYQLATTNESRKPLELYINNAPLILLFSAAALGLLAQWNWSRPLIIVLATWGFIAQLLPDDVFALQYGGESAWRVSVTAAPLLVPIVFCAWTFRFFAERRATPAMDTESRAYSRFELPDFYSRAWTTRNVEESVAADKTVSISINDARIESATPIAITSLDDLRVRCQWLRPRGGRGLLPARIECSSRTSAAFSVEKIGVVRPLSNEMNVAIEIANRADAKQNQLYAAHCRAKAGRLIHWWPTPRRVGPPICREVAMYKIVNDSATPCGVLLEFEWALWETAND